MLWVYFICKPTDSYSLVCAHLGTIPTDRRYYNQSLQLLPSRICMLQRDCHINRTVQPFSNLFRQFFVWPCHILCYKVEYTIPNCQPYYLICPRPYDSRHNHACNLHKNGEQPVCVLYNHTFSILYEEQHYNIQILICRGIIIQDVQ